MAAMPVATPMPVATTTPSVTAPWMAPPSFAAAFKGRLGKNEDCRLAIERAEALITGALLCSDGPGEMALAGTIDRKNSMRLTASRPDTGAVVGRVEATLSGLPLAISGVAIIAGENASIEFFLEDTATDDLPMAREFTGTVGTRTAIRMLIEREGRDLTGHYSFFASGRDLTFAGRVDDAGGIELTEIVRGARSPAVFTGSFLEKGRFVGSYRDPQQGGKAFRFSLRAVSDTTDRDRETTKVTLRKGAELTSMQHVMKTKDGRCLIDVTFPQVKGLSDAKVAATINDKLRRAFQPAPRDPETVDLRACTTPFSVDIAFDARLVGDGKVLSVTKHTWRDFGRVNRAHKESECFNLNMRTGAKIDLASTLGSPGLGKLAALVTGIAGDRRLAAYVTNGKNHLCLDDGKIVVIFPESDSDPLPATVSVPLTTLGGFAKKL